MRFRDLPVAARIHVAAVMAAGAVACGWSLTGGVFDRPWIALTLVLASIVAHTLKTDLALRGSDSTLSLGYAVTFASMLVFGPATTVWVAAAGGFAQCTLKTRHRNAWYQTVFSMSTLVLSVLACSATLAATGGRVLNGPADIVLPSVVASTLVYFLVNATLMAVAIGLSTGRSPIEVWDKEIIWGAPNSFVGALVATVAVQGLQRFGLNSVVLLALPLFLMYRVYKLYVVRIEEMSYANRQLHVEMERAQIESMTDPLTLLPNRRFLANHVAQEISRAEREGQSFAFIMLDLDDFKHINDTFGHQKGDEALTLVAASIRTVLRPYDVCCRYAGDEFAVVLGNCSADFAERRAETIVAAIAGILFDAAPGRRLSFAASAGVAVFPADGRTYHELLAAADARMYQRKSAQAV